ncbi:MAG: polyprenyl diphosphate synthase [Polyangia bacterium]
MSALISPPASVPPPGQPPDPTPDPPRDPAQDPPRDPPQGPPPAADARAPSEPKPELPAGLRHVAIIMDGNGRWAQQRGLLRIEGHRRGARSVREVVRAARALGLPALTLYAFSEQNWDRPLDEVQGLMQLLHDYVLEERAEILDNGIRLRTIGSVARLPDFVQRPLVELCAASAHHRAMTLTLALSYGGREALVDALRALGHKVRAGTLRPEEVDEAAITAHLSTAELPPVDLIVRTSGEQRTSNFLLWESAHAQFYTTPALWPDFGRADLLVALRAFVPQNVE